MKAAMIVVPILIILGIVGAGMAGVVDIPGLTPPKKKAAAKKEDEQNAPEKKQPEPAPPIAKQTPKPKAKPIVLDLEKGDKKLAKLWNTIDTETLAKITAKWKDSELAAVFQRMDPEIVAILLAKMDADRASRISREIRKQASMPEPKA
jgi:hypothetical protein